MPIFGSRYEIKKHIKNLFSLIEEKKYIDAKNICEQLNYSLKRYNISRGVDTKQFDEHISKLNYLLLYAVDNNYKPGILFEEMEKLVSAIKTSTSDPKEKLRDLHDEVRNCLWKIDRDNAAAIIESFDEISDLRNDFENIGGNTYMYYTSLLRAFSDVEPLLLQVAKIENPSATLLSQLADKFSDVFISFQRVFAPPIKIPLEKKDIVKHLENGASLDDISAGYGHDEKDLRAILQQESLKSEKEVNKC
jgi:hypothetical protein